MTTLSGDQIASLIVEVGWNPNGISLLVPWNTAGPKAHTPEEKKKVVDWLDTAIAVCLAESGGNTEAKNPNSSAIGLWQIMGSVHQKLIKDQIVYWSSELGKPVTITNPYVNTGCANMLYQQSGWKPWITYTNGAYKKHLGNGEKAYQYLNSPEKQKALATKYDANQLDNASITEMASTIANPLAPFLDSFNTALAFIRESGIVIGVFLLALVLIVLGAVILASQTKAGKQVIDGAKDLAKKVPV